MGLIEKAASGEAGRVEAASFTLADENSAAQEKECLVFVNAAERGGGHTFSVSVKICKNLNAAGSDLHHCDAPSRVSHGKNQSLSAARA